MKPRMDVVVTAFVLTLSLLVSARAQQGGGRVTANRPIVPGTSGTYGSTLGQAPRPMYLRGKVLFDDGNPASGATVELACNSGVQRQVFASADGSYSLDISARENSTFSDASTRGSGGRGDIVGSSGKWGGGTWFGAFRIPNLLRRLLVNTVGCSGRGRRNCGKLRATSNGAGKPVIRSFPSAVRTVEKQLRALAISPPELVVFPRFT